MKANKEQDTERMRVEARKLEEAAERKWDELMGEYNDVATTEPRRKALRELMLELKAHMKQDSITMEKKLNGQAGAVLKKTAQVIIVLLFPFVTACGLSKAQRIELVDGLTNVITKKVEEKLVPKILELTSKAVKEGVEELKLKPEEAKKLEAAANSAIESKLKEFVDEGLKPEIRKVVEEIVPEADEDTSDVGKAISGFLSTAIFGLLGIKTA